jgi:hypothetical protein
MGASYPAQQVANGSKARKLAGHTRAAQQVAAAGQLMQGAAAERRSLGHRRERFAVCAVVGTIAVVC